MTVDQPDYHRALQTLRSLRSDRVRLLDNVDKHRSWRASEKATAKAKYSLEIQMLDLARLLIEAEMDKSVTITREKAVVQ